MVLTFTSVDKSCRVTIQIKTFLSDLSHNYMGFFVFHHFTQQNLNLTLATLEKSTFCFQVSASKQPVHDIHTCMQTLK